MVRRMGMALVEIGASYRRNAAHLDISPRATISAGAVPDRILFEQMLADDLPWMMRFMNAAPQARLVLLAGTATNRYYLNEFLAKRLNANYGVLEGSLTRHEGHGKSYIMFSARMVDAPPSTSSAAHPVIGGGQPRQRVAILRWISISPTVARLAVTTLRGSNVRPLPSVRLKPILVRSSL